MAKTVIIYDQCGQEDLTFGVTEIDCSELDGKYINDSSLTLEQEDRINDLLATVKFEKEFPVQAVKDGAEVIVTGFIP